MVTLYKYLGNEIVNKEDFIDRTELKICQMCDNCKKVVEGTSMWNKDRKHACSDECRKIISNPIDNARENKITAYREKGLSQEQAEMLVNAELQPLITKKSNDGKRHFKNAFTSKRNILAGKLHHEGKTKTYQEAISLASKMIKEGKE